MKSGKIISSGVKSLFKAAKNAATGVDQVASEEVIKARLELCNRCPKLLLTRQCGECLCFVDLKTKLKQEKCPLDKWKEEGEENG